MSLMLPLPTIRRLRVFARAIWRLLIIVRFLFWMRRGWCLRGYGVFLSLHQTFVLEQASQQKEEEEKDDDYNEVDDDDDKHQTKGVFGQPTQQKQHTAKNSNRLITTKKSSWNHTCLRALNDNSYIGKIMFLFLGFLYSS